MTRQQRRARARADQKAARRRATLATGALAAGVLLAAVPAAAAIITVNSLADTVAANDLQCTLREAIDNANTDSDGTDGDCDAGLDADTIVFAPGLAGTILLTDGELPIYDSVTISGPGAGILTVSGNGASRIFNVLGGAFGDPIDVTVDNLSLIDGHATGSGGAITSRGASLTLDQVVISGNVAECCGGGVDFDGGLYSQTSLTITNSTISGNTAVGGVGGGVYAYYVYSSIYLKNNTITGNHAGDAGGGVSVFFYFAGGSFEMRDTVVSNNTAGTLTGNAGFGGGVILEGFGSFLVADSVITGNVADPQDVAEVGTTPADLGYGGGLAVFDVTGTVRRTTISGNTACAGGGVVVANGTEVTFENVTIASNAATNPMGIFCAGGGAFVPYDPFGYSGPTFNETTIVGNTAQTLGGGVDADGFATLFNSIVANNTSGTATTPDVSSAGSLTATYTLIKTPGSAIISGGTGNITGEDPSLGPLAANGSTVQAGAPGVLQTPLTLLPQCGSPVIDAGDPAFAPPPSTDQRGVPRVAGGRIDMGAVEVQPSTVQFTLAAQSVGESAGSVTVTVARTGSDGAITVTYTTVAGTASGAGTPDFTPQNGTLDWADGETANKTFVISLVGDSIQESNETFTATLSGPTCSAALGPIAVQTITILDDDTPGTADIAISKTAEGSFFANAPATYTITVTNHGPNAATSVVVTDVLPAGSTFVSATPSQGTCSGTTTVSCQLGTIADGGTATITLRVTPTADGPLSNTVTAAAAQSDPDPGDNSSTEETVVEPAAPIPTLHGSMTLLLAAALAGLAVAALRRRAGSAS